jgi:hypothetical protein
MLLLLLLLLLAVPSYWNHVSLKCCGYQSQ